MGAFHDRLEHFLDTLAAPPRLCFKLGKAMRSLAAHYERSLEPFGLTPARAFVLETLCAHGSMRFKDLAETVALEGATLSGILDRLERDGWVRREADPDDRRSLFVCLTPKGEESLPGILHAENTAESTLTSHFTALEVQAFAEMLDAIPQRLHDLVTS